MWDLRRFRRKEPFLAEDTYRKTVFDTVLIVMLAFRPFSLQILVH
jgi:hypothetical protein